MKNGYYTKYRGPLYVARCNWTVYIFSINTKGTYIEYFIAGMANMVEYVMLWSREK